MISAARQTASARLKHRPAHQVLISRQTSQMDSRTLARFSFLIRPFGSKDLIRWEFGRSLNYTRRFSDLILSQDRREHA